MLEKICGVPIIDVRIGQTSRYAVEAPKGFEHFLEVSKLLRRFCVEAVNAHGKFMYWAFSDANGLYDTTMLVTHGMSGRWLICQHADVGALRHVVISFDFADGRSAAFIDPRHFGTIRFGDMSNVYAVLHGLGDDIRHLNVVQMKAFVSAFMRVRSKTISEALMDQSVIAGVGNYMKAEVLWKVKMSPWRVVRDISEAEYSALLWAIVDVFELAVASRGATFKTHLNPDGEVGKMADFFQVYGKKLDPNGLTVVKQLTPDGRNSWWVPGWQR